MNSLIHATIITNLIRPAQKGAAPGDRKKREKPVFSAGEGGRGGIFAGGVDAEGVSAHPAEHDALIEHMHAEDLDPPPDGVRAFGGHARVI